MISYLFAMIPCFLLTFGGVFSALILSYNGAFHFSFIQKTWQRLKMVNILHDAVPQPSERVGYPMHVKVKTFFYLSNTSLLTVA